MSLHLLITHCPHPLVLPKGNCPGPPTAPCFEAIKSTSWRVASGGGQEISHQHSTLEYLGEGGTGKKF